MVDSNESSIDKAKKQIGLTHSLIELENQTVTFGVVRECWKQCNNLVQELGTKYRNVKPDFLKGRVAEVFHVGSFNMDAAAKGLGHRVEYANSNELNSPDIVSNWGEQFSLKYYKGPIESFKAQMKGAGNKSNYQDQTRIIPGDQLEPALNYGNQKVENLLNKDPESALRAKETLSHLQDRIKKDSAESKPQNEQDVKKWAVEANKGNIVQPEKHEKITVSGQFKDAFSAAGNAALISIAVSVAPTIVNGAEKLMHEPEYGGSDFIREVALHIKDNGVGIAFETFVKSSLAGSITIAARNDLLGEKFRSVTPTQAAVISQIAIETLKNINLWAEGKATFEVVISATVNTLIRSLASVAGKIAGASAISIPYLGAVLGSYVGAIAAELIINSVKGTTQQIILSALSTEMEKHVVFFEMLQQVGQSKYAAIEDYVKIIDCNSGILLAEETVHASANNRLKSIEVSNDLLKSLLK